MTTNDELADFRHWVHGLSHEYLLRAMEFEIDDDEYHILKEMVQLQAPPPTPIHPGILGYRPATAAGATDGRNEEERVFKARFQHPRLFQLMETNAMPNRLTKNRSRRLFMPTKRYEVIARKFITPWGQVLSLGCTQEQRDADEMVLKGTRVHSAIEQGRDRCSFCCSDSALRTLHVASRGKFLSVPPSSSTLHFCAPWLNADLEWFSLQMYLASRFEVALWASFRRGERSRSSWADPIQGAIQKLNASAFQNALLSATVKALGKDVFPKDGSVTLIRDGVVWNLIDSASWTEGDMHIGGDTTLTNVGTVSIVHLDSSRHKFQKTLWSKLQEAIAIESENEILLSLEHETVASAPGSSKRKKGRWKKKKKKRVRELSPLKSESSMASTRRTETKSEVQMPLVDPESIENAKEYTRKIIMAGMIIDDVLNSVFGQLGLNDPPHKEDVEITVTNCRKKSQPLGPPDVNGKTNHQLSINGKGKAQSTEPVKGSKEKFQESNRNADTVEVVTGQIQIEDDAVFPKLPGPRIPNDELAPFDEPLPGEQQSQDFHLESELFNVPWMFDESGHNWDKLRRFSNRERSLLADLFLSQKKDVDSDARVASSTAASIASSSDKGSASGESRLLEGDQKEVLGDEIQNAPSISIAPVLEVAVLEAVAASMNDAAANDMYSHTRTTNERGRDKFVQSKFLENQNDAEHDTVEQSRDNEGKESVNDCRSPSPYAPQTPPPQLSPILVSLADLQTIRTRAATESVESPKALSFSAVSAGSLPDSPMPASSVTLTPSWSREDLRIDPFTDDQRLHNRRRGLALKKRTSAPFSYRNTAVKSLPKARVSSGGDGRSSFVEVASREHRSGVHSAMSIPDLRPSASSKNESDTCAQSETAIDALSYEIPLNDVTRTDARENTEVTISTKDDGPAKSPPRGSAPFDEMASLRDERNAFRDMCLTLGAELSKLKNLLAALSGASTYAGPAFATYSSYDSELYPPYFHGVPKATTTVGAMSDVGTHRGDHDSAFSEDGTDGFAHDTNNSGRPRAVHVRRMSSGATIAASDISVEQNITEQAMLGTSSFRSLSRDMIGSISGHGMQSRLTMDILNFLKSKSEALRIQDKKKTAAIERLTRLVTAIWPRARVMIYGSHVTGLCLPSSDLDFVICLPAVHKNAPAVAPGALEGRNAINESSQKTLARMLKGESWIDPRSIKIIERTVVPVIKVSTKDTRARMIQLDISFDGPEHHGLAANQMITEVMKELPMIQPLVLVLKQFLKDRGLLTAYTGGLSSYGLFLMVTRYLQEQPSSWGDCGSLLMGFLDFYGNSFDPRATGISVGRRQYFARINYAQPQQMWDVGFPQHLASSTTASVGGRPDLIRRNSFNENATMDGHRVTISPAVSVMTAPHAQRPPRFQPLSHHRFPHQYKLPAAEQATNASFDQAARPYTFDPLFIEDPLSEGNNVGRNAFRIFQVQRAFSDAHRALVASLEWDIHSSHDLHDGEYPLLNCLLQSEDVFYELDDAR